MASHGQRINDNGEVTQNQHSRRLLTHVSDEEIRRLPTHLQLEILAQKIRDYQMLLAERDQIIARLEDLAAMQQHQMKELLWQQKLITERMEKFGTQMK